jgi:hypothetical protein
VQVDVEIEDAPADLGLAVAVGSDVADLAASSAGVLPLACDQFE